jgi:sugar-specific transcriptional regulator TrmB
MSIDFTSTLHSLGLSESETKIYLAGLKLGASSVQDIAKNAKLSRTAAYDAIESLKEKELLSTYQRGKKTLYVAEDPDLLLQHLRSKQQDFSNKISLVEKNLNDLKLLSGGEKPRVQIFQGTEMFYAFFDDVHKKRPSVMYEISNVAELDKHFPRETVLQARKGLELTETKIKFMFLGERTKKQRGVDYCKLNEEKIGQFHGDIAVYKDTVALASFENGGNLLIIENKTYANTQRVLMKSLWNQYYTE